MIRCQTKTIIRTICLHLPSQAPATITRMMVLLCHRAGIVARKAEAIWTDQLIIAEKECPESEAVDSNQTKTMVIMMIMPDARQMEASHHPAVTVASVVLEAKEVNSSKEEVAERPSPKLICRARC